LKEEKIYKENRNPRIWREYELEPEAILMLLQGGEINIPVNNIGIKLRCKGTDVVLDYYGYNSLRHKINEMDLMSLKLETFVKKDRKSVDVH
jgi:hypothetical protein